VKIARYALVAVVGFFGLAAQTLLFRDFFTVYEGNELGVAAFFCSWLLWVGLGALVARQPGRTPSWAVAHFEFLPLLYLPAYVLQTCLIDHARTLAGVTAYELFPFARIFPVSIATNAPVGFLSGLLFTLACKWFSTQTRLPAGRVYITEAAGAFVGGVLMTLLLAWGVPGESIFVYNACLVVLAFAFCRLAFRSRIDSTIAIVAVAVVLLSGLDREWTNARNQSTWQRVMPDKTYGGSFTTPQAKYLYGEYRHQFNVVAWGTVADSIPNVEHASEVLAVLLAQHPDARRFLVLGAGGFSLCQRLTVLPQAQCIVWLPPDPAYPASLLHVLPSSFKTGFERITFPAEDPRRYLDEHAEAYDMVIVNLPDVTTLALNRYITTEFFQLLKRRLAPSGMIGVRVTGGENFMGDERVNVGTSVYRTLMSVFSNLVIKAGDETWLMASTACTFSRKPSELRDRFQAIGGAADLYPPDALLSLYLPDRMMFQEETYRAAVQADDHGLLLNTDRHPRALLHSLLFAARRSGEGSRMTVFVRALAGSGLFLPLLPLALYVVLRLVFVVKGRHEAISSDPASRQTVFDTHFLVFSTGAVGMSVSILLMFMFQSHFGSLYLYMGLVSALFMLGLTGGGLASERMLVAGSCDPHRLAMFALPSHGALLGTLYFMPATCAPAVYGALFLAAGTLNGVYVPVAAAILKTANISDRVAGGRIAWSDHLGGAVGGLFTGLILLPLLGSSRSLWVLAAALAVNLVPLCYLRRNIEAKHSTGRFQSAIRPTGYILFGLAAFLIIGSLVLRSVTQKDAATRLASAVAAMAPDVRLETRTTTLASGQFLTYFEEINKGGNPRTWFFATDKLASGIIGYGGPVVMAVAVDTNGVIEALAPIRSNETPAYMDAVRPWLNTLHTRSIFAPNALRDVDAVTGATITSDAVLRTLREAGRVFAGQILGRDTSAQPATTVPRKPSVSLVTLVAFTLLALMLRAKPLAIWRRLFLLFVVAVLGVRLNLQYSLAQLFSLTSLRVSTLSWNASFLLIVGLPLLVLVVGNIYCGYLCPFGALQELVAWLRPARFNTDPGKAVRHYGRLVKYALLFLFTVLFAFRLNPSVASADPLVTLFGEHPHGLPLAVGATVLILSFFYDRFWCRYLCPTGAFLSLLNGVQGLWRFLPKRHPKLCVYGITDTRDLDCICCDRCRTPGTRERAQIGQMSSRVLTNPWGMLCLAALVLIAGLIACDVLGPWREPRPSVPVSTVLGSPGISRNVDLKKLDILIRQGKLSNHEAVYYETISTPLGRVAP